MDNDLNRSIRLLEDAVSTSGRGLFKKAKYSEAGLDISTTLTQYELEKLASSQFLFDETMSNLLEGDETIAGGIIQKEKPWETTVDSLYFEFFEVLQSQTSTQDALEVAAGLSRCCSDALKVVRNLKSKAATNTVEEEKWLEKERDTWRLLYILFQDRLMVQNSIDEDGVIQYFGKSEKLCVESLFKREHLIRECQLVIDWLEAAAREKDNQILHFSDATIGWENTLHQLKKSAAAIAFGSSRPIVDHIDPDAPHYEKRLLHDMDMDDDKQLSKKIFTEIRCGKLEEAQKLARQSGHSWKAAIFEGWHLFHDPNIKETSADLDDGYEEMDSNEMQELEGNRNRDIWKLMALKYAKQDYINSYERAAVAVFCGNTAAVLPLCLTWEDNLWAYMKSMVDIRVESEIRDCCSRENGYLPLPEEYWLQRMSLNDVFASLESSENKTAREESKEFEHTIQKYVILDQIPVLLKELEEWSASANISTHFLRFVAHLVLFLDQVGQGSIRESIEAVVEAYIKRLMDMKETQLVAFYVSKLSRSSQIQLYAHYLEDIAENASRKEALKFAEESGLDVLAITKRIVENIRNRADEMAHHLPYKLTEIDTLKISAIDWLVFYESQRAEVLAQSNSIIFKFLLLGKLDAAQLAFNKVPSDAVLVLTTELGDSNEEINAIIKEHLSYKAYLEAQEAFQEWFKQDKNKPVAPAELSEDATFPEKVAHQHTMSQYKAEVERWKLTTTHAAKTAKTHLYNVLLFPEGWLVGTKDGEHLRKMILPEITFLLSSLLFEMKMYQKCIQLADIIASEKHKLYEEFSPQQIETFLSKVVEASMALTKENKDAFGYELAA